MNNNYYCPHTIRMCRCCYFALIYTINELHINIIIFHNNNTNIKYATIDVSTDICTVRTILVAYQSGRPCPLCCEAA